MNNNNNKSSKLHLVALSIIPLLINSCISKSYAGGSGNIFLDTKSHTKVLNVCYGKVSNSEVGKNRLHFVIVANNQYNSSSTSLRQGLWRGGLTKDGKKEINYAATEKEVKVNTRTFNLANGRCILVKKSANKFIYKQIFLGLGASDYEAEIGSLKENKTVKDFF